MTRSFTLSAILILSSALAFAKPVAIHVVLDDGVTVRARAADSLEKTFAAHLPGVTFRKVIVHVDANRNDESSAEMTRIRNELKTKIQASLQPGDELTHLIIDTQGYVRNDMSYMVHIGGVHSVAPGPQFRDLFDPIKFRATHDLVVIINAGSVFQDTKEMSSSRARSILEYFNADNGSVYGSNNGHLSTYLIFASYMLKNFGAKLNDTLGINKGYFYEFHNGEVHSATAISRGNFLTQTLTKKNPAAKTTVRCQSVFL